MRSQLATLILSALCIATAATTSHAASTVLLPNLDTTIYAEDSTLSNGSGEYIFAGTNAGQFPRRALLRFDIAGSIPAGATINSVSLTLVLTQTAIGSGAHTVSLHPLLAGWGEGTANAPGNEGGGGPAGANDATWFWRVFTTTPWSTPGGDYIATASASQSVNTLASYVWTSTGMRDDVQNWLDTPASNFGWLLIGNENAPQTAKRFDGRQRVVPGTEPRLAIDYTEAPTGAGDLPSLARLLPAVPNPFNPSTLVRFELGQAGDARVSIIDARGRTVRVLFDGAAPAGVSEVRWQGIGADGARVASGVYFVRLEAAGEPARTQKLVLLK